MHLSPFTRVHKFHGTTSKFIHHLCSLVCGAKFKHRERIVQRVTLSAARTDRQEQWGFKIFVELLYPATEARLSSSLSPLVVVVRLAANQEAEFEQHSKLFCCRHLWETTLLWRRLIQFSIIRLPSFDGNRRLTFNPKQTLCYDFTDSEILERGGGVGDRKIFPFPNKIVFVYHVCYWIYLRVRNVSLLQDKIYSVFITQYSFPFPANKHAFPPRFCG